jgi:hypothetical protein
VNGWSFLIPKTLSRSLNAISPGSLHTGTAYSEMAVKVSIKNFLTMDVAAMARITTALRTKLV